jgi:hypothetical protein
MHNIFDPDYSESTNEEVMDDIVCPATIEMLKRMSETISKLRSKIHTLEAINQDQQDMLFGNLLINELARVRTFFGQAFRGEI